MNKDDRFYIKELQPIREFCLHSDKEDVYKYIYSLQQENQQLKEKVNQLETNRDEAIKEIKKRSTPEVAQLYVKILERGKE